MFPFNYQIDQIAERGPAVSVPVLNVRESGKAGAASSKVFGYYTERSGNPNWAAQSAVSSGFLLHNDGDSGHDSLYRNS